jgi:hypothetical protein
MAPRKKHSHLKSHRRSLILCVQYIVFNLPLPSFLTLSNTPVTIAYLYDVVVDSGFGIWPARRQVHKFGAIVLLLSPTNEPQSPAEKRYTVESARASKNNNGVVSTTTKEATTPSTQKIHGFSSFAGLPEQTPTSNHNYALTNIFNSIPLFLNKT